MSAYIITEGHYDDYHIVSVWLDKAKADTECRRLGGQGRVYLVEEWEVSE